MVARTVPVSLHDFVVLIEIDSLKQVERRTPPSQKRRKASPMERRNFCLFDLLRHARDRSPSVALTSLLTRFLAHKPGPSMTFAFLVPQDATRLLSFLKSVVFGGLFVHLLFEGAIGKDWMGS